MLDILKQLPYFGMVEKVLENIPKEYINGTIYKESSPKSYGMSKHKKRKKK